MKKYKGQLGYMFHFEIVARNKKEALEAARERYDEISPLEPWAEVKGYSLHPERNRRRRILKLKKHGRVQKA